MRLSKYLRPAPDFAEFGFRCASSLAGQAVTANVVTTVNLNTLIADDTGLMVAPVANVFVVPAGVWAVEAWTSFSTSGYNCSAILSLFDATNNKTRAMSADGNNTAYHSRPLIATQIRLASATNFELRILGFPAGMIVSSANGNQFTVATADTDQRASVKLWKLE